MCRDLDLILTFSLKQMKKWNILGAIGIRRRFMLILLIAIMAIFISSVSACDINNDTWGDGVNDSTSEGKLDVNLDAKEQVGIYGNTDTKLTIF